MSSKKNHQTSKLEEDENTDSGFLSGPISDLESKEDIDSSYDKNVPRETVSQTTEQLDSGLDLCLSECLSNVNISDSDLKTPTAAPIITIENKSQDIPPLAILFQQDDDGDTQLHIAAVHGCEKSTGMLVRLCPDKVLLDVPNDFGQTPLHLAAMSGHAVVARMLLRAGAKMAIRDLAGETPVHVAASMGHVECLHALLAPIPELVQRRLSTILNQKNYNGQTPVHLAAYAGHVDVLQTLVFYGADINAREGLCGWTPLHIACAKGDVVTARYLLERCAGVATGARDYANRTPRRLAKNAAASLFEGPESSDSESESDEEMLNDNEQSLFDRIREGMNAINVA